MNSTSGGDAKLTDILDRLLDPVGQLLASLRADADVQDLEEETRADDGASPERATRGENVSATIAVPKGLAKRGGQTFVRFSVLAACPDCGGTGIAGGAPATCSRCAGRGRFESERRLKVTFPPGVTTGAELRVSGEGNESPNGGPPGDLVLFVMLAPNDRLSRLMRPRNTH
jgi:DnaJ-class molecular chaperone